jgi:hypothetical protein
MNKSQLLIDRCRTVFKRSYGRSEYTRLFEDFPLQTRGHLAAEANLKKEEQPIIACFLSGVKWALITTQRLVWCDNTAVKDLLWGQILDTRPDESNLPHDRILKKLLRDRLGVLTRTGETLSVSLEPEKFQAFWQATRIMIVTATKSQLETARDSVSDGGTVAESVFELPPPPTDSGGYD